MEEKLGAILGDPNMMQQIMAMARTLNRTESPGPDPPAPSPPGGLDPALIQRLWGLAQQSGPDKHQQALLRALGPYLSRERIAKLEKAIRTARLAGLATSILGTPSDPGR